MKQKIMHKALVLVAAACLGLATSALADGTVTQASAPSPTSMGLLGQTFAGLDYSYVHLGNSPVSADRYSFEYNQPLTVGFDAVFNYDRTQNGLLAGDRGYSQNVHATLRAFNTAFTWGKPYVEAGLGYDWTKYSGVHDHSLAVIGGVGIEFQAATALTITPFLRYTELNGLPDHHLAEYGVKANYWVTKQLALTAGISRNDSQDMSYKMGVNVRF